MFEKKKEIMNILLFFKKVEEGTKLYSPLYGDIFFQKVRKFDPMENISPDIIECKTVANNVILFNHEGKPIIFHASGDMIYETNLGECMIYLDDKKTRLDDFIESIIKDYVKKGGN